MIIDLHADLFTKNPNAVIDETTDFDEEVDRMMKETEQNLPNDFEDV